MKNKNFEALFLGATLLVLGLNLPSYSAAGATSCNLDECSKEAVVAYLKTHPSNTYIGEEKEAAAFQLELEHRDAQGREQLLNSRKYDDKKFAMDFYFKLKVACAHCS